MIPPRLDHGAIGNGSVLALVSPTTAIDWLCMPRFDSPSVFGRLLDERKGGTFRFLWRGEERKGQSHYVRNTNVLRTLYETSDATWECLDFAPRIPAGWGVAAPARVVRVVRPLRGTVRLTVDFDPRMDYARGTTTLAQHGSALFAQGSNGTLVLRSNAPLSYVSEKREFTVSEPVFFDLAWGAQSSSIDLHQALRELDETIEGWRVWAKTCSLPLFEPALVLRSALCLKLHASEDTGAIIAAATTSIPEAVGTERTWDYRYCWLRDAAFVVEALRRLSHLREGERFLSFLRDVAESGPLQPVYALDGARALPELHLEHLEGFAKTRPVRIGNAAALQTQHDVMGEIVLCIETLLTDARLVPKDASSYFALVRRLVDEAIARAPLPDTGIWEFRSLPRNYTFSRAMCWAAVHRGARLARAMGEGAIADAWSAIASREQEIILRDAFNQELGCFTQALHGEHPDASNLLLPTLGLVDARDPRFLSTLDRYAERLVRGGLMLRYRNEDDFGETTSAFTICSFWWAEALALAGRIDEAIAVFRRVCSYANPLGLFSEDIEPHTGALLGNFPQAYTHVGLVHAAMTISELSEARDGRVRAWT
ncbi:MAG: glycoside hydrolase family 15 protein [Myxococcales bacterium]|nr:glycoside hydrolase family 15 protein [Myxococcales bacterium]